MSAVFSLVRDSFPSRSGRWVNDTCRAGHIRGARKIGGSWFWTPEDAARFAASGGAPEVPTVDAATADLRARGGL